MTLQEIVKLRLEQLNIGAVALAVQSGLERTYIRDIIEGRKTNVRTDKLPKLAKALKLDLDALIRGELVPESESLTETDKELLEILKRASPSIKESILKILNEKLNQ